MGYYVELVRSGKYSKEDLTETQLFFIEGIEYAMEQIENLKASEFTANDEDTLLDKTLAELRTDAADQALAWLEASRCEMIVTMEDGNAAEEGNADR